MSVRSFQAYRVAAVAALAFAATVPGQTLVISQFNVHLRRDLSLGETQLAGAYLVALPSGWRVVVARGGG
jgi:hypothetical protein